MSKRRILIVSTPSGVDSLVAALAIGRASAPVVPLAKPQAVGKSEESSSILADLAPVRREFERNSVSSFRSAVRDLRKGGRS